MADDEQSKSEFISILSSIDRKFDIIHTKWSEDKLFEAKFRTQIPRDTDDYNALCDEWVDHFSAITSTTWVKKISNTGPKIKFRKQYQCWTHSGEVQKELLFDARKCRATIDVKVLTDNPQTRRKNKYIKLGLNVVVKINFVHLHKVETSEPFSFFVHRCEPQPEAPKPVIQPNDKLPKLIADIVEKGRTMVPKALQNLPDKQLSLQPLQPPPPLQPPEPDVIQKSLIDLNLPSSTVDSDSLLQVQNFEQLNMLQLNQLMPLQSVDGIKLQVGQQLPSLAQVVVTAAPPQLEMNEPFLMCQQTLMFDPSQVIPVTAHTLPHHIVQVHPHSQGHYT